MQHNMDKWSIFRHPSKPVITASDAIYWKDFLAKTLKVGLEFEFNLKESKGRCKGVNDRCACKHAETLSCWKECIIKPTCLFNNCQNITATCESEDCSYCGHFKSNDYSCAGFLCSDFISKCTLCADNEVDCEDCENMFDPTKNPKLFRENITRHLKPSGSYGIIEGTGIHSVTTDGSLLGQKGVEIITVGRRINFWEFYDMAKDIIDISLKNGAYTSERTSIHMHVLAGYFSKLVDGGMETGVPEKIRELEKDVPEIILANFHQLCRRYQNAMTWMFMALNDPSRMTRWEKFRVSILDSSPIINSMSEVKESVKRNSGGNKYGYINYHYCKFNKAGDVSRFHIEARGMDNIPCPSIVAAVACMQFALVIKAVELSRYGILNVGDEKWLEHTKEVKECILNNMKDYQVGDRFGDTSKLSKYYDELRDDSMELLYQLKHILVKIGPAFEILERIAEEPVSFKRIAGKSWEEIEDEVVVKRTEEDELLNIVDEYIDLRYISKCNNFAHWIAEISSLLDKDPRLNNSKDSTRVQVARYVRYLRDSGTILWSTSIGAGIKM